MNTIKSQIKITAREEAIRAAKQVAREPWEVIKNVPAQVVGMEKTRKLEDSETQSKPEAKNEKPKDFEKRDQLKSRYLRVAYETELADIQRDKIFKEVLKKIQAGEEVNMSSLASLTWEQRQVLTAHQKSLQGQSSRVNILAKQSVSEPSAKPKRGLFAGIKTRVERVKRKSEVRMSPSG